jgi:predicted nucleotidyltransferase
VTHPLELKALNVLAEQGIARRARVGRADTYVLNEAHALADLIREVFAREESLQRDLVTFLRRQVEEHAPSAEQAYLFGSAARRQMTERSDIDVALVWPGVSQADAESASDAISESLRRRYGNNGQVIVRTSPVKPKERSGVWTRIVDTGIPLLAGRTSRRAARRRSPA